MERLPEREAGDDASLGSGVIACVWAPLYFLAVVGSISMAGTGSGTADGGHGYWRGGGNAPLLFQRLREVGGFEDGQRGQVFDDLSEVGHCQFSFGG